MFYLSKKLRGYINLVVMLEFFAIFSKSGIVLFATVHQSLNDVINGLVKHVFLQERTGQYQTDQLQIKYLMDNEFELVFVVGYQKFLQLCYVDKFLDRMQLAFRDKYSDFDLKRILNLSFNKRSAKILNMRNKPVTNVFQDKTSSKVGKKQNRLEFCDLSIDDGVNIVDVSEEFTNIYSDCVKNDNSRKSDNTMRSFQDSAKSKKTVASMIVQPDQAKEQEKPSLQRQVEAPKTTSIAKSNNVENVQPQVAPMKPPNIMSKFSNRSDSKPSKKIKKESSESNKKGKAARQWDLSGSNPDEFDFSKKSQAIVEKEPEYENTSSINKNIASALAGENVETNLVMTDDESSDDDEDIEIEGSPGEEVEAGKGSLFGSIWKSISYNKVLTDDDLKPVLDQLREHLTTKNVAAQIAEEICTNVGEKLKGLHVNTWVNLKKFARTALEEAILRILNPSKNINVLREVQAKDKPPYVIVLCGVNGVGKSTNLAKIANWLILNNIKVLVVAGDTFRAGAIEQLRTHVSALKAIHERPKGKVPIRIELYQKGYNRDTDNIAREAITYARANLFDCVIVDTAGRMQDNEPLMKQLAKLIKNNNPDLTLFVGEALVGNEAVDQLTKFNNSLIDNGCQLADSTRSAINGIVLTKFDTIDDQVGAAISMTYVTGKPIVFVGVGQTYKDLKQLDARAVTKALMR